MARKRKPLTGDQTKDWIRRQTSVNNSITAPDADTSAARSQQNTSNYLTRTGQGNTAAAGGVQPTGYYDPKTREWVSTGTAPVATPTYGAGAAGIVPKTPTPTQAGTVGAGNPTGNDPTKPALDPADFGLTPEMSRAMLADGVAYMKGFISQEKTPPGFFENWFTDKGAGKQVDTMVQGGMHWLSGLFDVEDESDLNIGGVNLSAVETVWDGFWKTAFLGVDAAAMAGSAGLLAANPHYWANRDSSVQATTASGQPVFDRQGKPMMITSTGNLWQDATQVSPGRALQALASPLQDLLGEAVTGEQQGVYSHDPNFNIADRKQRDDWYGNTPQSIGSGVGDATLGLVLDPTLAFGAVGKIARVRFLDGIVKNADDVAKVVSRMDESNDILKVNLPVVRDDGVTVTRAIEDLTPAEVDQLNLSEISRLAYTATARVETPASVARRASIEAIQDADEKAARLADFTPEYTKRADETTLFNHRVIEDSPNRERISQALHRASTYEQADMILRHTLGDASAAKQLDSVAPELYRHVLDGERLLLQKMIRSDPSKIAETVTRWEGVETMLKTRVKELVDIRAADDVIAQHRAMLSEVQSTLDYARAAEVGPVGAGPKPTAAEIDLASRAIDNQLRDNYLFERSLIDAEGDVALRGSLLGAGKGETRLTEGLEGWRSFAYKPAAAAERAIQKSRTARAMEAADVQTAGSWGRAFGAGQRSIDFYGIDGNPIATVHSVPAMAAGLFPNLRAGARYLWVEKPSGVIHTAGVTAQESSREIRAVVNSVDLFHQPAKQARNASGELLYRTSTGKVTTDAASGEAIMVGGKEAGEKIVQDYLDAFLLGSRESQAGTRQVIDQFEENMLQQVAWAHGIDVDDLRDAHYRINNRLQDIERQVKDQRYWTEGNSPKKNYAPWLETHLQNSTFMKNWAEIEKAAHRLDLESASKMNDAGLLDKGKWRAQAAADFAGNMFNEVNGGIQSVWRPLVLARGGYTIRNVAEGLFRGMAYSFSLAPIGDAMQQAELSMLATRRAVTASVGRKVKPLRKASAILRAEDAVDAAKAGATFQDMSPSFRRWHENEVATATTQREATQRIVTSERLQLAEGNAAYRGARISQLDNTYAIILDSRVNAQKHVDDITAREARVAQVAVDLQAKKDAALAAGRKWSSRDERRLKNASNGIGQAADTSRARAQAVIELNTDRLMAMHDEMAALRGMEGGLTTLSSTDRGLMDTLDWLDEVDIPYREMQLEALSDPTLSAMTWRNQTMAQRRIHGKPARHLTDTDTLASLMKGRALDDPFDPNNAYTSIVFQALSADSTVRQTAAMRMQAITGGMAAYETRYFTAVNPGTAEYFDGVATAANQVMNSDIGRVLIKGRAEGLGDDEILTRVVQLLYSPEGRSAAAFINASNDMAFNANGRFNGLTKQAQEAMAQQVRDNQPLYQAFDQATGEYRSALGTALSARTRLQSRPVMPPRTRTWSGSTFGDYDVQTSGRGAWTVTHTDSGVAVTAKNRKDARALARELQTADDDAIRTQIDELGDVTAGGRTFTTEKEIDDFLAEAAAKRDAARAAVDKAEAAPLKIPGTGRQLNTGPVLTPESIRLQASQGDADMVDAMEYAAEALRRYDVITNKNPELQTYLASIEQLPIGGRHASNEAGDIMRGFLTDANGKDLPGLQPVVGNTAAYVGSNDLAAWWHKKSQSVFKWIGTIPEDTFVRSPFYGRTFNREANRMFDVIAGQQDGFVSIKDVNNIRDISHKRALKETKDWLYTIDRQTTFGQQMEKFLPFSSAMQNSATAVGRLIWNDPKTIWMMNTYWQTPNRLGWDEDGDMFAMPIGWVPKEIRDKFGLGEEAMFSKKSFDVLLNISNSAPPMIAIGASELMKSNFFGEGFKSGTPPWLAPFGATGDSIWEGLKLYAVGDFGASQEFASWDRLAPAWLSRLVRGLGDSMSNSRAYGDTYSLVAMQDSIDAEQEGRPRSSPEALMGTANAMTIARSLAQLAILPVVPKYQTRAGDVPMNNAQLNKFNAAMGAVPADQREAAGVTGFETFTTVGDAIRSNDKLWYADQARITELRARQKAGEMIAPDDLSPKVMPSEKLFGPAIWRAYKLYAVDNTAGLPSTARAAKFTRDNAAMLRTVAPGLERHNMLEQIGMFAYNPDSLYTSEPYDANAQAYFSANTIPGTNEEFRQVDDPGAAEYSAGVSAGWQTYMRAVDALEIDALRNGVQPPFSPSSPKERYYYEQKKLIEADIGANFEGWDASKRSRDDRAALTTETIETAQRDDTFKRSMAADPVWREGGYASIYVAERRMAMQSWDAIKADAAANGVLSVSTSNPKSAPWVEQQKMVAARWATSQRQLKRLSPHWSSIQDRYIGDDLEPWKSTMSAYGTQTEEAS